MNVSVIDCLGIHEYEIERVYKTCQKTLDKYDVDIDLLDETKQDLEEIGNWQDIGNSIIHAMLSTTKAFLENYGVENVDYYVNGLDSHLYINGEEV